MLIGELVPQTLQFLRLNPAAPERDRFRHVLVDEYQDLNRAEQALLDMLAGGNALGVVGDNNQSIYRFKYAHPEGIIDFANSHPGTREEPLLECRRCPTRIVAMANSLIANNPAGNLRPLVPRGQNAEGEIYIVQWDSLEEESRGLALFAAHASVQQGIAPGRMMVLSPRRQIGYLVRDALREAGVPAHSFFHEEALDAVDAQNAFTLLSLLANREDRVSLRYWLGLGSPSQRRGQYARLRRYCEEEGLSPFQALHGRAPIVPRALMQRFDELQAALAPLEGLVGPELRDALFPPGADWSGPMRMAAEALGNDAYAARDLRESLRLQITQPELPLGGEFARVMSLHKSKGLTADLVIVADCVDGLIPTIDRGMPPAEQQAALEEQRRLFYVAVTRTTRILVLSSTRRLPRAFAYQIGAHVSGGGGATTRAIASPFLAELGPAAPHAVPGIEWLSDLGIAISP